MLDDLPLDQVVEFRDGLARHMQESHEDIRREILNGKISDDSPLGKALLGRKAGDVIEVEAPIGMLQYKILKVEK